MQLGSTLAFDAIEERRDTFVRLLVGRTSHGWSVFTRKSESVKSGLKVLVIRF